MEIKFENRYIGTKEIVVEYLKKIICKTQRICSLIMMMVSAILLSFLIYSGDIDVSIIMGLCLVTFICIYFLYIYIAKQTMDSALKLHNGTVPESIITFSDKIEMVEGSVKIGIEYSQITSAHNLQHIYVLMFGKRNGIMLKKDSFSIGSFDKFQLFIKSECKNIKHIK